MLIYPLTTGEAAVVRWLFRVARPLSGGLILLLAAMSWSSMAG